MRHLYVSTNRPSYFKDNAARNRVLEGVKGQMAGSCEHGNELSSPIKCEKNS